MVVKKLKVLKVNLKSWNKNVFGRVEESKRLALQRLDHWDGLES